MTVNQPTTVNSVLTVVQGAFRLFFWYWMAWLALCLFVTMWMYWPTVAAVVVFVPIWIFLWAAIVFLTYRTGGKHRE